jgi:hypothetical protein
MVYQLKYKQIIPKHFPSALLVYSFINLLTFSYKG